MSHHTAISYSHITGGVDQSTDFVAWYPDTDATYHFTPNMQSISLPQVYHGSGSAQLGNVTHLQVQYIGDGKISSGSSTLLLRNILHVSSLRTLLLYVQQFCRDNNCYFLFYSYHIIVKDQATHQMLLHGAHDGQLYKLFPNQVPALNSTRVSFDI